ncbi:unnamed protein product [Lactuca virosa]|uniref:Clp R domain-containing protein n=1 Tax=Lactuca virosa TaxID=75947 RepID=A0AAU9MAG2_9ASTR|nr:unnamed protein product [Lactuca virosa]
MMCSLHSQPPPGTVSAKTLSWLQGVNALDNKVNRIHDFRFADIPFYWRVRDCYILPKTMFDRFTENAIKVIELSQKEAICLGHNLVGTEMILLGLIAIPFTYHAKHVIEMSIEEAQKHGHNYIGTEHLLIITFSRVFLFQSW